MSLAVALIEARRCSGSEFDLMLLGVVKVSRRVCE